MITSRERVLNALNFRPTDRLPKDLAGMGSTGISAFSYPKLVDALGLPPRLPKVYDTGQMLALPDLDQRAHNSATHLVEESVALDHEGQQRPPLVRHRGP